MSTAATGAGVLAAGAPVSRRVRAFFAARPRVGGTEAGGQAATSPAAVFDAAQMGAVDLDAMPAPWVDLGDCRGFVRRSGTTVEAVRAGAPGTARVQVRTESEATVEVAFAQWGKLQLALSAGVQQMNLLATAAGAGAMGSGGAAMAAVPLVTTDGGAPSPASTATTLDVGAANAAQFAVGTMVAVDVDYTGQTGFVGSGASGGYVAAAANVGTDVDYVRRVTLNVGLVTAVAGGVLTLASPLVAGVPTAGMKVSRVMGFVDREGGGFFQEWTGLFCQEGEQGDRVWFYYPRLQAMVGAAETSEVLAGTLAQMRLSGVFRALATKDGNDGSQVLCYRSYLPAAMRMV